MNTWRSSIGKMEKDMAVKSCSQPELLVVDVDNTLICGDLFALQFFTFLYTRLLFLPLVLLNIFRGKLALKCYLASITPFDPSKLVYRQKIIDRMLNAKAKGRTVVLASGSPQILIERIAGHLKCIDHALGSNASTNLKGQAKLNRLRETFGTLPFTYIGDSKHDLSLWQSSAEAIVVEPSRKVMKLLAKEGVDYEMISDNADDNSMCWVCKKSGMVFYRAGVNAANPADFRITDHSYGVTLDLVKCRNCDFIQTNADMSFLANYEQMDDPQYEETRDDRALQARRLLRKLKRVNGDMKLLDVGAGSGILVEQAHALGWSAEGIEPSAWLAGCARDRQLPVICGVLPNPQLEGPFDVVTLVDVIEHVSNPLELLLSCHRVLKPGGRLLIVTPDVDSFFARILGRKWWHYRIAHIGYFNKSNLDRITVAGGFSLQSSFRPSWYFSVAYLKERLETYLPFLRFVPFPSVISRAIVSLNLRDSLAVIYVKN